MSGFSHQPFFWPQTSDPYFSDVALLLNFDQAGGSTLLQDSSSYADHRSCGALASVSTLAAKFGTGSLQLESSVSGGAAWPSNARFNCVAGQGLTVEWFFKAVNRFNGSAAPSMFLCRDSTGVAMIEVGLFGIGSEITIRFEQAFNDFRQYTYTPSGTGWEHIAVCPRAAGGVGVYVNGALMVERPPAQVFSSGAFGGAGVSLIVGSWDTTAGANNLLCYMDAFRYTTRDRYPSGCVVPAGPYPLY